MQRRQVVVPKPLKNMRACFFCSLVKTSDQFYADGCDNCEGFLRMKQDVERVNECTSANFDGMIGMNDPSTSWVAKWQAVSNTDYVRGVYAVSVSGEPHEDVIASAEEAGVHYSSRDKKN